MSYDKWKKRLAGEKVPTFTEPDTDDEGYYRRPITVKAANGSGRNVIVGWVPIAYFIDAFVPDKLCGVVGERDMTDIEIVDLWTWCVQHPITEEVYRAVAERGEPWPDVKVSEEIMVEAAILAHGEIGHNNPPPDESVAPDILMAEKIEAAMKAAPDLKFIETDEQAALVAGSRNRILELGNEAEKIRVAEKAPHLEAGRKVDVTWQPLVKRAEAAAAKLRYMILGWEDKKRKDQAAAVEAAQRAADRAIAAGEPEAPPIMPETPAPKAQVKATYGRAMPVQEKTFVEIDDYDAVYQHFKTDDVIRERLKWLAQKSTDSGLPVPGTHTRKGVI